jgi:hypothetical protein
VPRGPFPQSDRFRRLEFQHFADELRDLIKRETEQQIAAIDEELKGLGIAPDEFKAAAPESVSDAGTLGMAIVRRPAN